MYINDSIAQAYILGEDMRQYEKEWFFSGSTLDVDRGKNIFTFPPDDNAARDEVKKLIKHFQYGVEHFEPVNRPVWDKLFPDWQKIQPAIDLIVGFPEPYDAVTMRGTDGQIHLVFDLICWRKYAGMADLDKIIRNLLTHEITHLLIGKNYPDVDMAIESTDYRTKLDAYTFHEGFAHLISYQATELDHVDWHTEQLKEVYSSCKEKMCAALTETDTKKQEQYLYDAICGMYYEKFACMCGMLYLAGRWEKYGIAGLKTAFMDYHGFAERTLDEN